MKRLQKIFPENTATGQDIISRLQDQIASAALNGFKEGQQQRLQDVYTVLRGLGYPEASEALKKFMERI